MEKAPGAKLSSPLLDIKPPPDLPLDLTRNGAAESRTLHPISGISEQKSPLQLHHNNSPPKPFRAISSRNYPPLRPKPPDPTNSTHHAVGCSPRVIKQSPSRPPVPQKAYRPLLPRVAPTESLPHAQAASQQVNPPAQKIVAKNLDSMFSVFFSRFSLY